MDKNQNIAISKIADILSGDKLLLPSIDIWKKIFYNAGMGVTYETYHINLVVSHKQISWEDYYYHNDRCFSALLEILQNIEFKSMLLLFNSILDKITLYQAFDENVTESITTRNYTNKYVDIVEYVRDLKSNEKANELLANNPSTNFLLLRHNLNMLGLDITLDGTKLIASPFTYLSTQTSEEANLINTWLSENYPNILKSYEDARKAYGSSDPVGCLTHCRNIITGILSYKKSDKKDWDYGLQQVCKKDKNIANISNPKDILKYNKADNYNYPRFRLIYRLYSYLCDLGPHINEGNLVDDKTVDIEDTDMTDAFMGLRMTEDILIWLYQNT
ncbi:hypothetical protein [Anaerotignum sp.]|uniref:hypothetical protein n=1 Tax=Anaerotignum sp. TaxID=2039241 RepID=UPI002714DC7B|nr:hypothetical protein [Anaerotignum sp.]